MSSGEGCIYMRRDWTQLRLTAAPDSYETNYGTVLISSMFRVVDVKLPTSSTGRGALFMHTLEDKNETRLDWDKVCSWSSIFMKFGINVVFPKNIWPIFFLSTIVDVEGVETIFKVGGIYFVMNIFEYILLFKYLGNYSRYHFCISWWN